MCGGNNRTKEYSVAISVVPQTASQVPQHMKHSASFEENATDHHETNIFTSQKTLNDWMYSNGVKDVGCTVKM